jgi:hypothetical protein
MRACAQGVNMVGSVDPNDTASLFSTLLVNFSKLLVCPVLCYFFALFLGASPSLAQWAYIAGGRHAW